MAKYVLGIDFGTTSVRVGIFDLKGNEVIFRDEPYELITPRQGWAEQRPSDWWSSLCIASKRAISDGNIDVKDIAGIGTDTTACTLVFLDEHMEPLCNAIMWMDVRAADQARRAAETKHPVMKCTGFGNASAEWMPHKALWLKENAPEIYNKAAYILECEDWLGYKLTGRIAKNMNDASTRWYYDNANGGWQTGFFDIIGLDDVMPKIPSDVVKLGGTLGKLTKRAADDLGLIEGIPVAEGGADAYVGTMALGVVREGRAAMITGSSHLFCFLTKEETHLKGMFGSFPDAIVEGYGLMEAGQASTGSIVNWMKNSLPGSIKPDEYGSLYGALNREAEKLPIGSDGLICMDYFQGCRAPYVDGEVRGMIGGLSLMHSPVHIYKALIESVCYGSEVIFRLMRENGINLTDVYACGGATKSRFWMQTHADVSNININIPKVAEAPVLGAAILGSVAGGVYGGIVSAVDNMTEVVDKITPDLGRHEEYKYYVDKYAELYPLLSEWMHGLVRHEAAKGKGIKA